jgi:hypothetical protein
MKKHKIAPNYNSSYFLKNMVTKAIYNFDKLRSYSNIYSLSLSEMKKDTKYNRNTIRSRSKSNIRLRPIFPLDIFRYSKVSKLQATKTYITLNQNCIAGKQASLLQICYLLTRENFYFKKW